MEEKQRKSKKRNGRGMEKIIVHPYEWEVLPSGYVDRNGDKWDHIVAHCTAKDTFEPYLVRIHSVKLYCYIELPTDGRRWRESSIRSFMRSLSFCMRDNAPISYEIEKKNTLYRMQRRKKYTMVKCYFRTQNAVNFCGNLVKKGIKYNGERIKCKCWGTEKMRNSTRTLLTEKDMGYSQWFLARASKVPDRKKISNVENEYLVNCINVEPIPDSESCTWKSHPGVLSFDIECYCHNHKAFPNERVIYDSCFMISCIYQRIGLPETRKRVLLVYGMCRDIEGIEVRCFKTELEMLDAFADVVNEFDPEIIMGHNIFGFDLPYMDTRLKIRGGLDRKWKPMGRIKGQKVTLHTEEWSSSGAGHNKNRWLVISGRIFIDTLLVARNSYKLPRYTLDSIGKKFLGRGKHDVSPEYMNIMHFEQLRAIYLDSKVKCERSATGYHINIDESVIKEVNEIVNDSLDKMTKTAKYCDEDSALVIDFFEKTGVWIGMVATSNVVGVSIFDLYTRGQQMRVVSMIMKKCHERGIVVDSRPSRKIPFVGGKVQDPIPGLHHNIIYVDFKSLYPFIQKTWNLCYSTFIEKSEWKNFKKEECIIFKWTDDIPVMVKDPKSGKMKEKKPKETYEYHHEYRFIKPKREHVVKSEGKRDRPMSVFDEEDVNVEDVDEDKLYTGVVPGLVKSLIDERDVVRTEMKTVKDPLRWAYMNSRQLALKVSANSFYGAFGAHERGRLPLPEAAICTTYKGRQCITACNDMAVSKHGMKVVYGDTDSTMLQAYGIEPSKLYQRGIELAKEMTNMYPPPMKMELECIGSIFCIKKKKYAFWKYNKDGTRPGREKIEPKGILLNRREACSWQREIYREALYGIMEDKSLEDTIEGVCKRIEKMAYECDYTDMIMIKGINKVKLVDTHALKKLVEKLVERGKNIDAGMRLDYIVLDGSSKKVGDNMEDPVYYENLPDEEKPALGRRYYMELASNTLDNVIYLGYKKQIDECMERFDRQINRRMISYMRKQLKVDKYRIRKSGEFYNEFSTRYLGSNSQEKIKKLMEYDAHRLIQDKKREEIRTETGKLGPKCKCIKCRWADVFGEARRAIKSGNNAFNPHLDNKPVLALSRAYKRGDNYFKMTLEALRRDSKSC